MWQAQKKVLERENRRKDDYPVVIVLGDSEELYNCHLFKDGALSK